jgi:hypothetical protein
MKRQSLDIAARQIQGKINDNEVDILRCEGGIDILLQLQPQPEPEITPKVGEIIRE